MFLLKPTLWLKREEDLIEKGYHFHKLMGISDGRREMTVLDVCWFMDKKGFLVVCAKGINSSGVSVYVLLLIPLHLTMNTFIDTRQEMRLTDAGNELRRREEKLCNEMRVKMSLPSKRRREYIIYV